MKKILLVVLAAATAAQAASFYLTVSGLGGEEEYEQRFSGWATDLNNALKVEKGAKVELLSGAKATKANIQAQLTSIAAQAKAEDTFVLAFIGHGSWDDLDYKFNLPGQDLSAGELNLALDAIRARQLVVLGTSASGGAIDRLKKKGRILVAATRAGRERNATVFARFWVAALADPAADTDKDETLSALEAYNYAQAKTKNYYTDLKRLATEHSVLEDTGDKEPQSLPSGANGQGQFANSFPVLHFGEAAAALANPAKKALFEKKEQLQTQIDAHKYAKASMPESDYNRKLQQLLLELARTQAELDK